MRASDCMRSHRQHQLVSGQRLVAKQGVRLQDRLRPAAAVPVAELQPCLSMRLSTSWCAEPHVGGSHLNLCTAGMRQPVQAAGAVQGML